MVPEKNTLYNTCLFPVQSVAIANIAVYFNDIYEYEYEQEEGRLYPRFYVVIDEISLR